MRAIIIVFFIFFVLESRTQNLVPNGSFEHIKKCPDIQEPLELVLYNWYSPNFQDAAVFNSCANQDNNDFGMPYNLGGFQYALDSNGYVTFAIENAGSQREYLSLKLLDSLKKNCVYDIIFFVNCNNHNVYAADEIGIYISNDSIYLPSYYSLPFIPQISSPQGVPIDDTAKWYKISGKYKASGGEQYITIGQFKTDANTYWKKINPLGKINCFYNLDKVSITLYKKPDTIIPPKNPMHHVFPNPVSDKLQIEFEDVNPKEVDIVLYDVTGRKIAIKNCQSLGMNSFEVNLQALSSGIYFYRLFTDKSYFTGGKFVVLR